MDEDWWYWMCYVQYCQWIFITPVVWLPVCPKGQKKSFYVPSARARRHHHFRGYFADKWAEKTEDWLGKAHCGSLDHDDL